VTAVVDTLRLTAEDAIALVERGEVSPAELHAAYLGAIGEHDGELHAFLRTVEHDDGTSIPIALKDVISTRGIATTAGSRMLEHYVPVFDATVTRRCRDAGLSILGKTNTDEFAMGSSTENSAFGPSRNPWDPERVPGGSGGGTAAAVSAGLAPWGLGSDTGGSIKQPSALCGNVGLRPTYGTVSRYGIVAFASSLDQAGPLGKSAADLALMMNVMAGFDARDSTSVEREKEDYARLLDMPVKGLRIGLPREYFGEGIEGGVLKAVQGAIDWFAAQGAKMVNVQLPNARLGVPVYYVIAPAEASSNLSRFDGARYGHRAAEPRDLEDMYCRTRAEGFGAEVKRRILVGTYVLSHGYYDAYYLQAQKVRRLIAADFARAFKDCDVILGPTAPTTAFAIGEKAEDPVQMYLNDIFTIPAPLAGLPALAIPCGFDAKGLPVGLQLTGNYFCEALLLGAAHRYQQASDWHLRVPSATPL
jgi:aspartyl-tRNA(Asn)/glutamyl-tRNA(Gln) amidotransferase subunit A